MCVKFSRVNPRSEIVVLDGVIPSDPVQSSY